VCPFTSVGFFTCQICLIVSFACICYVSVCIWRIKYYYLPLWAILPVCGPFASVWPFYTYIGPSTTMWGHITPVSTHPVGGSGMVSAGIALICVYSRQTEPCWNFKIKLIRVCCKLNKTLNETKQLDQPYTFLDWTVQ